MKMTLTATACAFGSWPWRVAFTLAWVNSVLGLLWLSHVHYFELCVLKYFRVWSWPVSHADVAFVAGVVYPFDGFWSSWVGIVLPLALVCAIRVALFVVARLWGRRGRAVVVRVIGKLVCFQFVHGD